MGKLPAQLGDIGVTINGIPAYVYYVSSTQINVLTPLDNTLGPVSVVVTNGGISSLPFTATLRAAAPSFLLLGTTQYDAAEHVDGSLLGPASISVPGFSFTPAQQGETIVLFAAGFALPVTTLTQGSSTQSGSLPALRMRAPRNSRMSSNVVENEYQTSVSTGGDCGVVVSSRKRARCCR